MRSWRPEHSAAGFIFPAGKDVVFELRTKSQPELILYDRDLILYERAVNIVILMMRRKVDGRDGLDDFARTPSSAQPPDNFISLLENEMMKQIDVQRVAGFPKLRSQSVGAVVVSLNLEVRRIAQFMAPAS